MQRKRGSRALSRATVKAACVVGHHSLLDAFIAYLVLDLPVWRESLMAFSIVDVCSFSS